MRKNALRRLVAVVLLSGTSMAADLVVNTTPSHANGTCASVYDVVSTPLRPVSVSVTVGAQPCLYPSSDGSDFCEQEVVQAAPTVVTVDNVECVHPPQTFP